MSRTDWPSGACRVAIDVRSSSLLLGQYISKVQHVLTWNFHSEEDVFLQISVFQKEVQHITLCNTEDCWRWSKARDRETHLSASLPHLVSRTRALRNCLQTNNTPKHKTLKLSIVVILWMKDYYGFLTWTNYFTSLGLISELQVSRKVLVKGGFGGEYPEIALTTYLGKQVSYRKRTKRLFRLWCNLLWEIFHL